MKRIKLFAATVLLLSFIFTSCIDYESLYNESEAKYADLETKYNTLLSEVEELKDKSSDLRSDYDSLKLDYNVLNNKYKSLDKEYAALQDDYAELQDKSSKTTSKQSSGGNQTYAPSVSNSDNTTSQTNTGYIVTVTRTGEKYHTSTCRYVKNKTDTTTYSLSVAKSKGYTACKICKP